MQQVVVISVPAPTEFISANDRRQRYHHARVVKEWRQAATWAAKAHRLPSFGDQLVRITATVHKPHARRYDAGNYYSTAKACVDGLRDSGLLVDDDNDHVIGPDMRRGAADKVNPRLTLEIRVVSKRCTVSDAELVAMGGGSDE